MIQKKYLKNDLIASVVVFLIAIPLCLGIAVASGAPPLSGLISGIVGGIFVGFFSKSNVSVCGPAAGLVAIVIATIETTGSFQAMLLAVAISGLLQIGFGFLRAGSIAYFFPATVIKGMLSAIGIIIFMKQIPHFIGYDENYEGDLTFFQEIDSQNTFSEIFNAINYAQPNIVITGIASLVCMILWDKFKKGSAKMLPGALLSVIVGLITNAIFTSMNDTWIITSEHLVNIPVIDGLSNIGSLITFPDFSYITSKDVWISAGTFALVASIETLLTIEATDKIDPLKRITPTNKELIVQGSGNFISGLLGGLPITSVIVRSSANIDAGGRSKISTISHGILILLGVIFFATFLNKIPLTSLAAILLVTGYKLANPKNVVQMFKKSKERWIPFIITLLTIVFTDLLIGITVGLCVGIAFVLIKNLQIKHYIKEEHNEKGIKEIEIKLPQEVSFLNKASLLIDLENIKDDSEIIIDGSNSYYIDDDVIDVIKDFVIDKAHSRNIKVNLKGLDKYLK